MNNTALRAEQTMKIADEHHRDFDGRKRGCLC